VIPPPLGGARALEGHWTDAPSTPVRRVKFGVEQPVFGWIAPDDDLTTNVFATAAGRVSEVYVSAGDRVAPGAPLFAVERNGAGAEAAGSPPPAPKSMITSPAAGTIVRLDIKAGQAIRNPTGRAAGPVASIADLSTVWLTVQIEEGDARLLQAGDPVEAHPTTLADRTFSGRLLSLSPVDPATGLVTVRAAIDNADGSLKPDLLASLTFTRTSKAETLVVPESAVLFEYDSARVFVVETEKNSRGVSTTLQPRTIRPGRIRDGMVEVLEGLDPGANVEAADALFIDRAARGY
ncbi:MAG: efflux RND transporter periplasmic adaptor subunit, partial [Methylobacteriaceae bacterium]|nr:efflux RND transporter periplasmic adaptor subunit [Methylobacteriaceae bacterium]